MKMHVAIIGAGAAGLTAGWELTKAGNQVTIFEAQPQVGGLAAGFRSPNWDWWLDKFYHHWFATDSDILDLTKEIGFEKKVLFGRPRTKTWIDGNLYQLSTPLEVLSLPLSVSSKLRVAFGGGYLKLPHGWQHLDHIPAYHWLQQVMGNEASEKLWNVVLKDKFKEAYQQVPLSWLWAHIYNRSPRLAIFEGGFQALWEHFGHLLVDRGVSILLNTRIDSISLEDGKHCLTVQGECKPFDAVVSTLSPHLMLKVIPALANTDYARQLLALKSIGAVCLVLALNQPFLRDGIYGVNLPLQAFPFINLFEHTNLVSSQHYGGDHLLYCVDYVPTHHPSFQMPDEALQTLFTSALPRLNPSFSKEWIRSSWVFRTPFAQPIPELNSGKTLPSINTPLPGVYWIHISQAHPWGKGTTFAVRLGKQAAKMIIHDYPPLLG